MEDVYFENTPMSGEEIAQVLGISRMAVSNSLKRSLKKIFFFLKKTNKNLDSFEIAVTMSELLNVSVDNSSEMSKFFNLFPPAIKREIKENAKNYI